MSKSKIATIIQRSEEAIAFYDIVWGEGSEEEIRDAKIRLMIKKHS